MNKQTENTKNTEAPLTGSAPQEGTKTSGAENEGEGSRSGARAYDKDVRDFVKSGQVESSAREAEKAVDGPEGADLRKAEHAGKRGGKA